MKSFTRALSFRLAFVAATFGCSLLEAGNVQVNGTILGIFSNVVLQGSIANDPSLGQLTYLDNTGTADYSIVNSTNPTLGGTPPQRSTGSALNWGSNAGQAGLTFSTLIFFGNPVPAGFSQPFQLGTITYSNGTSALNSLIFGATISFYDNSVSPETYLGSDNIVITTTQNLNASTSQDADYINICGNNSNICNMSLEAVESTQGGNGVTANLYGTITGDPQLTLTSIALAAGQDPLANGFVGADPPVGGTVPEPAAAVLMSSGLALVVTLRRRKRA